jgi:hypothetical protein
MSLSHYVTRVIELLGYYGIKQRIRMERNNERLTTIICICVYIDHWVH